MFSKWFLSGIFHNVAFIIFFLKIMDEINWSWWLIIPLVFLLLLIDSIIDKDIKKIKITRINKGDANALEKN